jgi:diamine N-acetyltransferase
VHREQSHTINLTGNVAALGPLSHDLLPEYQRWNNELSTSQTLGLSWPTTLEEEARRYEHRVSSRNEIYFTVFSVAHGDPVGIAYLYEIDHRHARASFGIVIGSSENRGIGYGTEATSLVLDYAFNALGLSNVMLTVLSFNHAGIRAYEKAGFREFGRRRTCSRSGNRLWDLVYMECIAAEFKSPQLTRFLYDHENEPRE